MSNKSCNQSRVLCPFYITDESKPPYIRCEGVTPYSTISMEFTNKITKNEYIDKFCGGLFKGCKVYNSVNDKYEE